MVVPECVLNLYFTFGQDEYLTEEDEEWESLAEEQSEACPNMQAGEGDGSDQFSEKQEDLLMKLLAMILLSWQTTFKISDNAITSRLMSIKHFMQIIGNVLCADSLTSFASNIERLYSH